MIAEQQTEVELVDFVLIEHWDISRLNKSISEHISIGYTIADKIYQYMPQDGSGRTHHVVPMAKYREIWK